MKTAASAPLHSRISPPADGVENVTGFNLKRPVPHPVVSFDPVAASKIFCPVRDRAAA
jgi:hypothetical protein